jgi:tRNA U34 5-carboxymethylaminomethyl modifying GTPase MnmE/TrmE
MYFCYEMSREQMQARGASRIYHADGGNLSALEIMHGKKGWRDAVATYRENIADKVAYMGLGSGLFSSSLEELIKAITETVGLNKLSPDDTVLITERQRECAERALKSVTEALSAYQAGITLDAVGVLVDSAVEALLELTGKRVTNEVAAEVFKRFCIGK